VKAHVTTQAMLRGQTPHGACPQRSARRRTLQWPVAGPLVLMLVMALSGCASLPSPGASPALGVVTGDPAFELNGRLAVRQDAQAISASLRWRHDGLSEEMILTGPLGAGSAELLRDPGGVTLRSGGREQRAADAETLMRAALGFALPLDGLRYWVRGQTAPGERAVRLQRDALGRLVSFHEAGWQVSIVGYSAEPLAALPRRIDVESDALRVRLVIDQWLQPPAGADTSTLPTGAPK